MFIWKEQLGRTKWEFVIPQIGKTKTRFSNKKPQQRKTLNFIPLLWIRLRLNVLQFVKTNWRKKNNSKMIFIAQSNHFKSSYNHKFHDLRKPMENINPEDENFWLNPIILNQVKTLWTSDKLALLPVFQYPTNLLKPVPAKILNFVSQLYL